jgi:hypothetical protein
MLNTHGTGGQAALARHGQVRDGETPILVQDFEADSKFRPPGAVLTTTINLKRIEARDRRRAAVHEAGHHVMARYRGMCEVDSWIERVGDPTPYEKSWVGHCSYRNPHPEAHQHDVMIGVAGVIAAALWDAGNDLEQMDDLYDLLDDPYCMSASDWSLAGLSPNAGFTKYPDSQLR